EALTSWICPAALTRVFTVSPTALSLTRARKPFTTPSSTSASSSERRTSRSAASMLASESSVRPARRLRACRNPLVSASNMGSPRGGGLTTRDRLLGGSLPGARRYIFEVLGRFAGGLGRKDGYQVAPGRSTPNRYFDRRVGDQRKARQSEEP